MQWSTEPVEPVKDSSGMPKLGGNGVPGLDLGIATALGLAPESNGIPGPGLGPGRANEESGLDSSPAREGKGASPKLAGSGGQVLQPACYSREQARELWPG